MNQIIDQAQQQLNQMGQQNQMNQQNQAFKQGQSMQENQCPSGARIH
jgi:hypothetical protein